MIESSEVSGELELDLLTRHPHDVASGFASRLGLSEFTSALELCFGKRSSPRQLESDRMSMRGRWSVLLSWSVR